MSAHVPGTAHEPELFGGVIGRTVAESTPWWPAPKRPSDGSPNVLVVVFDDVGFAQFGCYCSTIETPNLDRLADGGLRFVNFHTTALCSPTRACILTGRNHHSVGMRAIWTSGAAASCSEHHGPAPLVLGTGSCSSRRYRAGRPTWPHRPATAPSALPPT